MNVSFVANGIDDCPVIQLDKHTRPNGNITVVEDNITVPFDIRRVYYLYDVPGGEERGGHAHRNLYQLIVAASGSFDVILDDGKKRRTVSLNRPYYGLLIRPGIWRELNNFSSGAVSLVLASELYDEGDYIREYSDFLREKRSV
ncbi:sugar 3,4-ketoisomerase [Coprobacter sp.]